MGDGHRLGRPVAVLGQNQVRLTAAGIVAIERIGSVQQNNHVGILLKTIMCRNPLCYKVISARYSSIVDIMLTDAADLDDFVPEDITCCQGVDFTIFE